ncbi:Glutamyl-tRNA amidotransferase B subunit [Punctularia strigosozonata HHB-11173 SS5]|uniref:Glutamyl-tRNA amidotransferase B subunit n=1 Tax=Punctularia strigosozonata (strain HHB-11173) TaxID=741275 RepID=UPI00044177C3|nr:Glutamyl-tRNA amidotransferase B subunit [Punctularia strigosozonata HHB-11173 SS5]EIN10973.1 Glutamyl-tRNA amidotransferase B subunit [Punctularia strigosozonata HHB-11173 SS5]
MLASCARLAHHGKPASRRILREAAAEDKRWPGWEVVVGIEVHAQIKSRRKLFSGQFTRSDHEASPNMHVSAYDAAFPGTLPRLNPTCLNMAIRTALALNSNVQTRSSFDRKHYFYSDLPSGYQITQHYSPISLGGYLQLRNDGHRIRIKQIQIEQDTGKSTFDPRLRTSLIDLNRAGTGLMEIVSEPDLRSPEQAGDYIKTLQATLRAVGSSDGNMEQGSLRCDVNVSVNRAGDAPGTRCEIKNLNSIKFAQIAIVSEVYRHISLIENGQKVQQETRGFDEARAETYSLRSKEDAPDYRYMPDPNLPPIVLDQTYIEDVRTSMPELPEATRARLLARGLSDRDVQVLMAVDAGREVGFDGKLGQGAIAVTHELLGQLLARGWSFHQNPMSAEHMGEFVDMVQQGRITGTAAKALLRHMLDHSSAAAPLEVAQQLSLLSLADDTGSLEQWCKEAIDSMLREAEEARQGDSRVLNKFMGRVMKISRGRADAKGARAMLQKLLSR